MDEKRAFVFDTNFIIEERKNLKKIIEELSTKFSVYVTQVSIDERISQKYIELKKKYEDIAKLKNEYQDIAKIIELQSLDEKFKKEKVKIEKSYAKFFENKIIPFTKDRSTFSKILDRAYKKQPPFLSIEGASDKGFKDSLIWVSILDYFKNNGENSVIFVTGDNAFKRNIDSLCEEFHNITNKKIEIKDNSYHKSLLEDDETPNNDLDQSVVPNVSQLREEIDDALSSLCGIYIANDWGLPEWSKTFILSEQVDKEYMKVVFERLKGNITNHLFDKAVSAREVLALDDRITDVTTIPIDLLEKALHLYEKIKKMFPEHIEQFFSTAANIINNNYNPPDDESNEFYTEDELPF
jgi:hypothetical protein